MNAKMKARLIRAAVRAGAAFSVGALVLIVGYILIMGVPNLTPELFAWTLVIVLMSVGFEKLFMAALGALERRLTRL